MKKLISMLKGVDNNMTITEQIDVFDDPFIVKGATEELNALIAALAETDPYAKQGGRVSPWCIHCKKKFDANAVLGDTPAENNIPAQHAESCAWFQSFKLAALCRIAGKDGI